MDGRTEHIKHRGHERHPQTWPRFTYISDSGIDLENLRGQDVLPLNRQPSSAKFLSLSATQVGDRVRVASLNCGRLNQRLMRLGLVPDTDVEVVSCTHTGSVVVSLQTQHLGLGAAIAHRIQVTDVNTS